MLPHHSSEQGAVAALLLGELAEYDAGLARLLEEGWDAELYREVSDRFDRMQMCAQALPRLAVSWSELLISRVELMQAMWSLRTLNMVNARITAEHARHRLLLQEVARKCLPYLPQGLH